MRDFINVYDLDRKKVAVLQNAYNIKEIQELNKIYSLEFSIPSTDNKIGYLQPFHYVRYGNDGQLYRIIKNNAQADTTGTNTISCEHVIATLCDDIMFGAFQYGGTDIKTEAVITWLLSQQKTQNWELKECDFDRKFEYGWEQENLLNALYAIPKEFSKAYQWVFDTVSYPWKLSLKEIDENAKPEYYIRAERNLLGSESEQDFADICTRIYPLGYGEGVNQLNIKDVNNGVPYLQSPDDIIAKYGIKEKVLVDRRYENAESLKEYAQTTLDALQVPGFSRSFDVVDLYPITSQDIDDAAPGKICKLTMDGTVTYITKTERVLDDPGNLQIELSTKATDVASSIADLAERVRIESVYAQGATQLYQHSKDANATKDKGSILSLYFPSEMRQINKVLLKVELTSFRAYSQTTSAGGGSVTSSSAEGGTTVTSAGGGGSVPTSLDGGATIHTDTAFSETGISVPQGRTHSVTMPALTTDYGHGNLGGEHYHYTYSGQWSHSHQFSLSEVQHKHGINFNIDSHSHLMGSHTHSVTVPSHTHEVSIPEHTHSISPGIYESGGRASAFSIYVNGTLKKTINSTQWDGDIVEWLTDTSGTIPRGTWIKVELRPNDLAYVISSVFVQGFVQSRGGGNY